MKKIKVVIVLLALLTIVMVVKQNSAKGKDKERDIDVNKGMCHFIDQTYKKLSFTDKLYRKKYNFEFVINIKDLEETKYLISNEQLIDLKRQLVTADTLYQEVLGLTPPLDQPRYKEAAYIRIIMAPINGNGLSFDEVTADKALGMTDCHISMKLKATLKASNGTPAHELFHLYQNSYFMFKNRWLTEGTAQWSESLLNKGVGKKISTQLPQTQEQLEATMQLTYNASVMWTRLFQLVDEQAQFTIPSAAASISYLNGTPVIKDNKAYGTSFIKVLFEALEEQSKQAANDKGWETYNWKESDQKSSANNVYVWKAVQNAVNKAVPVEQQSEELKRFLNISLS